jgi:hypothetical protein
VGVVLGFGVGGRRGGGGGESAASCFAVDPPPWHVPLKAIACHAAERLKPSKTTRNPALQRGIPRFLQDVFGLKLSCVTLAFHTGPVACSLGCEGGSQSGIPSCTQAHRMSQTDKHMRHMSPFQTLQNVLGRKLDRVMLAPQHEWPAPLCPPSHDRC